MDRKFEGFESFLQKGLSDIKNHRPAFSKNHPELHTYHRGRRNVAPYMDYENAENTENTTNIHARSSLVATDYRRREARSASSISG